MLLPKVRDRSEIRLVPRSQHPKPDILVQFLLYPPRGKHSHTVPINQDLGHHPRMVRWLTALFFLVYRLDCTQIQLLHQRRRRNTPSDLQAASRPGSAVTENLALADKCIRFFPCSETWHIELVSFNLNQWFTVQYSDTLLEKIARLCSRISGTAH